MTYQLFDSSLYIGGGVQYTKTIYVNPSLSMVIVSHIPGQYSQGTILVSKSKMVTELSLLHRTSDLMGSQHVRKLPPGYTTVTTRYLL